MVLAVERDLLRNHVWTLEHVDSQGLIDGAALSIENSGLATHFHYVVFHTLNALLAEPESISLPFTLNAIKEHLLAQVTTVVLADWQPARPSLCAFSRSQVVKRARDYIRSRIDEPLQMIDLCRELRISRRTLQYSFQDVLGASPITYLRLLRLNGVRNELLSHRGEATQIKDVVARWGFWHFSRFRAEYRKMFGELPSETLCVPRVQATCLHI